MGEMEAFEMIKFAGGTGQIAGLQRLGNPGEIEVPKIAAFRQRRETVNARAVSTLPDHKDFKSDAQTQTMPGGPRMIASRLSTFRVTLQSRFCVLHAPTYSNLAAR